MKFVRYDLATLQNHKKKDQHLQKDEHYGLDWCWIEVRSDYCAIVDKSMKLSEPTSRNKL